MKIYFAGSIRGGRADASYYKEIIAYLQTFSEVLTEHIGSQQLPDQGEHALESDIHHRDLRWLRDADIVIAEVSTPSLGVGYEIGRAVEQGKRVVCLYRTGSKNKLSAMIRGCEGVSVVSYTDIENLKSNLALVLPGSP